MKTKAVGKTESAIISKFDKKEKKYGKIRIYGNRPPRSSHQ